MPGHWFRYKSNIGRFWAAYIDFNSFQAQAEVIQEARMASEWTVIINHRRFEIYRDKLSPLSNQLSLHTKDVGFGGTSTISSMSLGSKTCRGKYLQAPIPQPERHQSSMTLKCESPMVLNLRCSACPLEKLLQRPLATNNLSRVSFSESQFILYSNAPTFLKFPVVLYFMSYTNIWCKTFSCGDFSFYSKRRIFGFAYLPL